MERPCSTDARLANLPTLEPDRQASVLAQLAQEARLIRMALSAADGDAERVASSFERALSEVMDADAGDDSRRARRELAAVLADARSAGLTVSATIDHVPLSGALGPQRLPVLTAVLCAG